MRVKGNIYPELITVEPYLPARGKVEVRVRENVKEVTVTDSVTGEAVTMYEYDEYVFHLDGRYNLKEEISQNMGDWLSTGKSLEVDENASRLRDMSDENDSLMADIAQMVDEVYQSDIEMIGL